jgi:hypothetical protein
MSALNHTSEIRCERGVYLKFSDESGAELYLQGNKEQELIGFNPHFAGKSRRKVSLTESVQRDSSELDGGFHAWAGPNEIGDDGEYPFIFDVPDFRTVAEDGFPKHCEIQLTAFGSNDFELAEAEDESTVSKKSEPSVAVKSFVSSGLAALIEMNETDLTLARPIASFAGEVKDFELKTNKLSNEMFCWFLVETLGGEIDIVVDPKFVTSEPQIGGIVSGTFWLSGRVIA